MVVADPAAILFATALATAAAGLAVAWVAYRGYRRNDSAAMLYLAIGIAFVTAGPFLVSYGLSPAVALSDATTLLGVLGTTIAGLLSILYSLEV